MHYRIQRRGTGRTQTLSDSKLPALNPALVLVILRVALGAFFVSTFFENLGKGLYSADGYAELIRSYIQHGHAPAIWKQVMEFTAAHAAMAGPMQAVLEASLGVLLIFGFLSRPAALVAFGFLTGLWMSEWGIAWIWELLVPMIVAASLALGPVGRHVAVDVALARRWPNVPIW
ncbi:MAG: DoxX family membrane protein [Deltaproteobacteria bacterium]|nr:DoxX family membrane protein [Deltaproteobacteria bacterium]MBV8454953.1 DoxX family membrane protein [Deltaproteobacteria bacterium]